MSKHVLTFIFLGLIHLLAAAAVVLLLWKGGWNVNTEAQRLDFLGKTLLSLIGVDALFGCGILIAGPLHDIRIKAGPVEVDLDGNNPDGPQHN